MRSAASHFGFLQWLGPYFFLTMYTCYKAITHDLFTRFGTDCNLDIVVSVVVHVDVPVKRIQGITHLFRAVFYLQYYSFLLWPVEKPLSLIGLTSVCMDLDGEYCILQIRVHEPQSHQFPGFRFLLSLYSAKSLIPPVPPFILLTCIPNTRQIQSHRFDSYMGFLR